MAARVDLATRSGFTVGESVHPERAVRRRFQKSGPRRLELGGNGFKDHLFFTVRGDRVPCFSNPFPQQVSEGKRMMRQLLERPISSLCTHPSGAPYGPRVVVGAGDAENDEGRISIP